MIVDLGEGNVAGMDQNLWMRGMGLQLTVSH
jgi:hypothetical protein